MSNKQHSGNIEMSSDVDIASGYARRLVYREAEASHVNVRKAVARVANHLRLPGGTLWALLYSPPKEIGTQKFQRIQQGFERHLESELMRLEHELLLFRTTAGDNRAATLHKVEALLAEARALLDEGALPVTSLSEALSLCTSEVLSA